MQGFPCSLWPRGFLLCACPESVVDERPLLRSGGSSYKRFGPLCVTGSVDRKSAFAGYVAMLSSQGLDAVAPAVLGDQHTLAFAHWPDNLPGQAQHGGLVGGAVADNQGTSAVG